MGFFVYRSLYILVLDYICYDVLRIWRILEKEERCVVFRSFFCIFYKFSCDDLRNYKFLFIVVFLQICSSCRNQQQFFSLAYQFQIWVDLGFFVFLFFFRNIRVVIFFCFESIICLFRIRFLDVLDVFVFNEVFWVFMFYLVFYQKILRVDVCIIDRSYLEECLVRVVFICLFSLFYWGLIYFIFQGEGRFGENRLQCQLILFWVLGRVFFFR